MSFILDAIKKSEDRRNQNKQQNAHSLQAQLRAKAPSRGGRRRWLEFFGALLLLALAAWFFKPLLDDVELRRVFERGAPTGAVSEPDGSVTVDTGSNSKNAAGAASVGNADVGNAEIGNSDEQQARYAMDDVLPPRHLIKELWELPADFQERVPEMEFSFHFYSKQASKSSVVINGRSLREGQMVASQTKLRLITSSGVIVYHDGQFFHIDVVEKW